MKTPPPENFDLWIRAHAPEPPTLSGDFRERVRSSLRRKRGSLPTAWLAGPFVATTAPGRLVIAYGLTAVLFSAALGVWLGREALPNQQRADLFPSLTSPPELVFQSH